MFKVIYLKNFRRGRATNSSSTHSIIYKNDKDVFEDLNVFENNYFDRCTRNIAATREAKIKYIFHCIWRNDSLVHKMAMYYPEMKQWFPLAKKAAETPGEYDVFGEHSRGSFVSNGDINIDPDFAVDYLRYIIETENAVIVGGSDEQDFVYDTIKGHEKLPKASDIWDWDYPYKKNGIQKNGNYYVAYGDTNMQCFSDGSEKKEEKNCSGGRIRFMTEDSEPIPEYPELIDLRITNKCDHGCKFCFMNSGMKEKEADIRELLCFVHNLKTKTEFSIGGGNILLYSKLEELFQALDEAGHIINVTINVKDCDTILKSRKFKNLFKRYVDGIGVSVFNAEDAKKYLEFKQAFDNIGTVTDKSGYNRKYITMHVIPEYIGADAVREIMNATKETYYEILFLGYKENGRGSSCEYHTLTEEEIKNIFSDCYAISIDTTFAKRYGKYLKKIYSTRYSLTENEGEYSMYIDGITMNAYKSSYETDKPYYVGTDWKRRMSLKDAFSKIREDNGFPVYKPKHYYDEV